MSMQNFCFDNIKSYNWQEAVKKGKFLNISREEKNTKCKNKYEEDRLDAVSLGVAKNFLKLYKENSPVLDENNLAEKLEATEQSAVKLAKRINAVIEHNISLAKQKEEIKDAQKILSTQLCMKVSECALKGGMNAMAFNTEFVQHQQKYIDARSERERNKRIRDEAIRKASGLKTNHNNLVEVYIPDNNPPFVSLPPKTYPRTLAVFLVGDKC